MRSEQQKNIKKTVWVLVAIMVTILVLFINKITTPRYLSQIELKINGLVLLGKESTQTIEELKSSSSWTLLVDSEEEKKLLENIMLSLDNSVKKTITVVEENTLNFQSDIQTNKSTIPIIKPSGEYIAYLVSPYDRNKVILTLSSVVTHR